MSEPLSAITILSRKKAVKKYPSLPQRFYDPEDDEEIYKHPKTHSHYIYSVEGKNLTSRMYRLIGEVLQFLTVIGTEQLVFLGDTEHSWLERDGEAGFYYPVEIAFDYLKENGVNKHFNGAVIVEYRELVDFMTHLVWLTRTNGILPYVHWIDPAENLIGHISHYAELHISLLNEKTDNALQKLLRSGNSALTLAKR